MPIFSAASRCVIFPSRARFNQSIQSRSSWFIAIRSFFSLAAVNRNFLLGSIRNFSLGRDRQDFPYRLRELAKVLYSEGEDPSAVTRIDRPYSFEKIDGRYEIHLRIPFASKGEIGLFKKADELVVEVGTLLRHIGLPTSMAALVPGRARLIDSTLVIEMKES